MDESEQDQAPATVDTESMMTYFVETTAYYALATEPLASESKTPSYVPVCFLPRETDAQRNLCGGCSFLRAGGTGDRIGVPTCGESVAETLPMAVHAPPSNVPALARPNWSRRSATHRLTLGQSAYPSVEPSGTGAGKRTTDCDRIRLHDLRPTAEMAKVRPRDNAPPYRVSPRHILTHRDTACTVGTHRTGDATR